MPNGSNARLRRAGIGLRGNGSLYLGNVATRVAYPFSVSTSNFQGMSLSGHFARDNISGLKILLCNSWAGTNGEFADGAATTVTASVEYPIGATPVQITFGGSASGTIPNGGLLLSDWCLKTIPKYALFRIRIWRSNSAGLANVSTVGHDATLFGDVYARSATTVADDTMTNNTPTDNASGNGYAPLAIISYTRQPSIALVGDSRVVGQIDTLDTTGARGIAARTVDPYFPWMMFAVSGTTISDFTAGCTNRLAAIAYCSHVICGYPVNDMLGNAGIGSVKSRFAALWALFPNQQVFQMTVEPDTTSASGNWTSAADQTAVSFGGGETIADVNAFIKTRPAPLKGIFDIATAVADPTDVSKWRSDGTNKKYTGPDGLGVHCSAFANLEVMRSQQIDVKALHR